LNSSLYFDIDLDTVFDTVIIEFQLLIVVLSP